jgi:hypothetical protein
LPNIHVVALCALIAGCGTTGATKTFVLPIDSAVTEGVEHTIKLGSFAVAEDANVIVAAGTQEWGAFDEADQHKLEWSLQATLDTINWRPDDGSDPGWEIHALLRRHVVAHDNNSAGVLVCISWVLASASGDVIYQDQFYAADSVMLVGTLGGVKNSVNRAVARRIIESSLRLASSEPLSRSGVERTYDSITEAAEILPSSFRSLPIVRVSRHRGGVPMTDIDWEWTSVDVVRPQDGTLKTVGWEALDAKEPVRWQRRLED